MMPAKNSDRLAVLIDADNAQASGIENLLAEISRYGTASVKRAYGDWTTANLQPWKDSLHRFAIQPIQQFSYTKGKNSTDSSLIIDAMDLLHAGNLDGYCLVSSDSDFTRLATRLRESGATVYGFGEKKTPVPFVSACDKFTYTEILRSNDNGNAEPVTPDLPPLESLLRPAIEDTAREDGWSHLGQVGALLGKNHSSFDTRNYQFSKLSDLARKQPYVEVEERPSGDGKALYVRLKGGTSRSKA